MVFREDAKEDGLTLGNFLVDWEVLPPRPASARSEHGWNVAESQPSVGSKLKAEADREAAPIPEVFTTVTVVSLMNPSFSFQNVYRDETFQFNCREYSEAKTFLEIIEDQRRQAFKQISIFTSVFFGHTN